MHLGAHANDLEVPPSRGTEFTDPIISDRNTSNASPTGNTTIRSLGESVKLLHEREKKSMPERLNINKTVQTGSSHDPPQKSPLSFRSDFLSIRNKNEDPQRPPSRGHERLSSVASSSPRSMKDQKAPARPPNLGKNYEYFTGNTVFWGSGRFQNSRDKPVNIATGLLIVLPVALFLAYSYVSFFVFMDLADFVSEHLGYGTMCHQQFQLFSPIYFTSASRLSYTPLSWTLG